MRRRVFLPQLPTAVCSRSSYVRTGYDHKTELTLLCATFKVREARMRYKIQLASYLCRRAQTRVSEHLADRTCWVPMHLQNIGVGANVLNPHFCPHPPPSLTHFLLLWPQGHRVPPRNCVLVLQVGGKTRFGKRKNHIAAVRIRNSI